MTTIAEIEHLIAQVCDQQQGRVHVDLEAFIARQLPNREQKEVRSHIAQCEQCRQTLALYNEVQHLWQPPIPAQSWWRQLWRTLNRPPMSIRLSGAVAVLALVGLATYLSIPWQNSQETSESIPQLSPKGGFALHVVIGHNDRQQLLTNGEHVSSGDRLGFFYSAEQAGYLAIYNLDNEGTILQLYPLPPETSAPIEAGQQRRLGGGARLTDGEECEWIIAVYSSESIAKNNAKQIIDKLYKERTGCVLNTYLGNDLQLDVLTLQR